MFAGADRHLSQSSLCSSRYLSSSKNSPKVCGLTGIVIYGKVADRVVPLSLFLISTRPRTVLATLAALHC